jgi:pantoate--beta-alanine ligase
MRTVRTVAELRRAVADARASGNSIALVPTMGYLHEGHLSLVRRAAADSGFVVASLFVNPSQFGPGEDYERYPRDEERDAALAADAGADLLFVPTTREVYPDGFATTVSVAGLSDVLCGSPGSRGASHFDGVATVVAKLLNMCAPDAAYFGQKDYQQSLVIRRVVRDLDMQVKIEVCPTVRDADGLALSSRNAYLSASERERALGLSSALRAAERVAAGGAGPDDILAAARAELDAAQVEPEYLEVLAADDLSAPSWRPGERVVIAIAAQIGPARLIDNTLIELPVRKPEPAVAG